VRRAVIRLFYNVINRWGELPVCAFTVIPYPSIERLFKIVAVGKAREAGPDDHLLQLPGNLTAEATLPSRFLEAGMTGWAWNLVPTISLQCMGPGCLFSPAHVISCIQ